MHGPHQKTQRTSFFVTAMLHACSSFQVSEWLVLRSCMSVMYLGPSHFYLIWSKAKNSLLSCSLDWRWSARSAFWVAATKNRIASTRRRQFIIVLNIEFFDFWFSHSWITEITQAVIKASTWVVLACFPDSAFVCLLPSEQAASIPFAAFRQTYYRCGLALNDSCAIT